MAKAKEIGIDAYLAKQREKKTILTRLLRDYDDGRHDVFFCLAVNMLDIKDLKSVLKTVDQKTSGMTQQEKASVIEQYLRDCGEKNNIPLVLRR